MFNELTVCEDVIPSTTGVLIGKTMGWFVNYVCDAALLTDNRILYLGSGRWRFEEFGIRVEYYNEESGSHFCGDGWCLTSDFHENDHAIIHEHFDTNAEECLVALTALRLLMAGHA